MFTTKLNPVAAFALVTLGVMVASIEPVFAQASVVPAPIVGAGLPALAILGGGNWLVRKLRQRRYALINAARARYLADLNPWRRC